MHPTENKPAAEVVLTVLHAGGKFENDAYKVSGGLHGVGVSVVNALSERLEVEIWRDGGAYRQEYEKGTPFSEFRQTGTTKRRGTKITFKPDAQIFEELVFSCDTLAQRLRELAFLNKGLKITLKDERAEKPREMVFHYEGGIVEFVQHLNKARQVLNPKPIYLEGDTEGVFLEIAMQWNDSYNETIYTFANSINTVEGGTHLVGFKVVCLLESQAFKGEIRVSIPCFAATQPSVAKARSDLRNDLVIREKDDFNARVKQRRDDVALQEVDDGSAVVGGDKDTFGHYDSFLTVG